ncbi:MAG: HAD family hydrolase, partial [bacterium]|nr:HAD family hydrolase [bacterium]
ISSTSESLIQKIMSRCGILKYFSIILGKHGPKPEWENVLDKANQLIKLSNLTGIPLGRTVFIGDNNSDYKSAKQLGVKFIEARIVAEQEKEFLGKDTLIDYEKGDNQNYFTSYSNGVLEGFLEEINDQVAEDKYNLDQKFLP